MIPQVPTNNQSIGNVNFYQFLTKHCNVLPILHAKWGNKLRKIQIKTHFEE